MLGSLRILGKDFNLKFSCRFALYSSSVTIYVSVSMWFILPFLTTCLVIVCLLMIVVVLMQRPKSEGLGAAFGGGMTDNLFGAETTNVLSRFTVWLGGLFFLLTLVISILYVKRSSGETAIQKQLLKIPPMTKAIEPPQKKATPVPSL